MFKKAEKRKSYLRLAITAPSGGGKTFTALRVASGIAEKIGSRIAFIDTEHGSASLYADKFDFDVLELQKPFTTAKYIEAMKSATQAGYKILVLDSTTHGWQEILDHIEKLTQSKYHGNSFRAWGEGTPMYQEWIDSMLAFKGHLIATMRSKMEYVMETNNKGRQTPKKVGLGAEQRKGIEYEFTMVMEGTVEHLFTVSKDRTSKYQDQIIDKPGEEFGSDLVDWLNSSAIESKEDQAEINHIKELQSNILKGITYLEKNCGWNHIKSNNSMKKHLGTHKPSECNDLEKLETYIAHLKVKFKEDKKEEIL